MQNANRHPLLRDAGNRDAIISLVDAAVTYPNGTRALLPTTLSFARGSFTVLLGPSGAGKSTLLRSLNGLVMLSEGAVLADGFERLAGQAWRRHRRTTGMVFQQHQLIGRLNALANVLMGRLGHHSALRTLLPFPDMEKRLALDALGRVGMLDLALRRVDQLSGGQQQRVGIARALAQQPRLILADEPVASLDPTTAEHVLALLHGICRQDELSAIVSLHQIGFARRFADRIVGIAGGRVVYDGPPHGLDDNAVLKIYGEAPAVADINPEPVMEVAL